jgi:Glycosyl transferase family 2
MPSTRQTLFVGLTCAACAVFLNELRFGMIISGSTKGVSRSDMFHLEETRSKDDLVAKSRVSHSQRALLLEVSSKHVKQEPYNITAAVCHKTLFGNVDIWTVIDWAVYHYLLGFDRIFLTYTDDLVGRDGFEQLQRLPFVDFSRVHGYAAKIAPTTFVEPEEKRKGKFEQIDLMDKCLQNDAFEFDWVLLSDADEYLWFNESISVKKWLSMRCPRHINYISFGKSMYTKHHSAVTASVNGVLPAFYLSEFPFTAGLYCRDPAIRNETCGSVTGRSKVMVQPAFYSSVPIHGNGKKGPERWFVPGHEAHLKEWRGANALLEETETVVVREPENFETSNVSGVHIHRQDSYYYDGKKSATMYCDDMNAAWFAFVASRARL